MRQAIRFHVFHGARATGSWGNCLCSLALVSSLFDVVAVLVAEESHAVSTIRLKAKLLVCWSNTLCFRVAESLYVLDFRDYGANVFLKYAITGCCDAQNAKRYAGKAYQMPDTTISSISKPGVSGTRLAFMTALCFKSELPLQRWLSIPHSHYQ